MRFRPVTPERLIAELADRIAVTAPQGRLRVAIDGAPAAEPELLAGALVDPLRARGRPALHVRTEDFLRPASLRLEHGRRDPDSYYDGWFDLAGLRREVLDPAGPAGCGRVLPSLWDSRADRASRADYVDLPPGGVLLVSGALLAGAGLPVELTVHLLLTPGALGRRTPADQQWTLPAFARYADEVAPHRFADVVVRADDPRRPALGEPAADSRG